MTPMHDELIAAFDDDLRPLGPLPRDEVHRRGWWHHVFHCLVVRTTPPARVLLQRRSAAARSFAGLLDLTATGHLVAGEEPFDGVRELHEEVGLIAEPGDLVPLGTRLVIDDSGEGRNREIVHVFLLPHDQPLASFEFDDVAVDGVVEIDVTGLAAVLGGGRVDAHEVDRHGEVRTITVGPDDLVPSVDDSWTAISDAVARFVAGDAAPTI